MPLEEVNWRAVCDEPGCKVNEIGENWPLEWEYWADGRCFCIEHLTRQQRYGKERFKRGKLKRGDKFIWYNTAYFHVVKYLRRHADTGMVFKILIAGDEEMSICGETEAAEVLFGTIPEQEWRMDVESR